VLKMTATGLDAPWETMTLVMHRSCMTRDPAYPTQFRCLKSSRSVMHVLQYSPHTLVNWI